MPQQKPLPVDPTLTVQLDLLLHPEHNITGYVAFEDAKAHPFMPNANTWSRVNAWWLADASWLAYSHDEAVVRTILNDRAGLPSCTFIAGAGTSGYIAHNNDVAIVAFRGTQPDDWNDLFDILRLVPLPWDVGFVHNGFADALTEVWDQLHAHLSALPGSCRIWLTGHSLGAALAFLTAARIGRRASGVYTFGAPRVGDAVFAAHLNHTFQQTSMRYVNDHDVVTHVPPEHVVPLVRYTHADHLRWINKDGQVGTTPPTLEHFLLDIFGRPDALLRMVNLAHEPAGFPLPDTFKDHTPLYYALHTWNDFAVNGD